MLCRYKAVGYLCSVWKIFLYIWRFLCFFRILISRVRAHHQFKFLANNDVTPVTFVSYSILLNDSQNYLCFANHYVFLSGHLISENINQMNKEIRCSGTTLSAIINEVTISKSSVTLYLIKSGFDDCVMAGLVEFQHTWYAIWHITIFIICSNNITVLFLFPIHNSHNCLFFLLLSRSINFREFKQQ